MERYDIFRDIAERTGGDIYIGVVGPVRTGKSTFIKRFMELMVIPQIQEAYDRERAVDELPQSGSGKTIMTTEPKFVPDEAVGITVGENIQLRVRLVDCVGYSVEGAMGYQDENGPRMVVTPWAEEAMTFQSAAEMGTQKVITEHSTIGLVITTDGSITDIPRDQYVQAEERVIAELNAIGKPFILVINSTHPWNPETQQLAGQLSAKYNLPAVAIDCMQMKMEEISHVLSEVLSMFPVPEVQVELEKWVDELDQDHWLRKHLEESVFKAVDGIYRVRDISAAVEELRSVEYVKEVTTPRIDLGQGSVSIMIAVPEGLFYQILQEVSGFEVEGNHHLMRIMKDLSKVKKTYDRVSEALQQVQERGYGIVNPSLDEIEFAEPEVIHQGSRCGVRIRANAPSIHMVRAQIMTEVTPVVGTEKQGEEFVQYLTQEFERDPAKVWQTEFFGKSLNDLIKEGIQAKLNRMPENAQEKLQETLTKIINDGSGGLICIII
ncbi:MAG TPA: stage IV sporulation protein A [Bacillota bacterium]|nr:stage IV sporulation protein A [Bacillota bacterium]